MSISVGLDRQGDSYASGAYANGGTYHHAEFVPLKSIPIAANSAVNALAPSLSFRSSRRLHRDLHQAPARRQPFVCRSGM
jgi:hypothetical protein